MSDITAPVQTDITAPTCDDLGKYNRNRSTPYDFESVDVEYLDTWRWGVVQREVFRRKSDGTLWAATWRQGIGDMNQGEANLADGTAHIERVYPHEKVATVYTADPAPRLWLRVTFAAGGGVNAYGPWSSAERRDVAAASWRREVTVSAVDLFDGRPDADRYIAPNEGPRP